MSEEITDNLRADIQAILSAGTNGNARAKAQADVLLADADLIDKRYMRAIDAAFDKGEKTGFENQAAFADNIDDEWLLARGLMRLPVDADGEPWHVGDEADVDGKPCTISCIRIKQGGWSIVGNLKDGSTWKCNDLSRAAHHKPTIAKRIEEVASTVLDATTDRKKTAIIEQLRAIAAELEGGAE